MDHKRRSFKVAVSIYHVRTTKKGDLKLHCPCIMCGLLKKNFKVAVSIYHEWITKEEVFSSRVYILYVDD